MVKKSIISRLAKFYAYIEEQPHNLREVFFIGFARLIFFVCGFSIIFPCMYMMGLTPTLYGTIQSFSVVLGITIGSVLTPFLKYMQYNEYISRSPRSLSDAFFMGAAMVTVFASVFSIIFAVFYLIGLVSGQDFIKIFDSRYLYCLITGIMLIPFIGYAFYLYDTKK